MRSKLVSIRIPESLLTAVKERAGDRPWQTVLKELLAESLGLRRRSLAESRVYKAPHVGSASSLLRPKK